MRLSAYDQDKDGSCDGASCDLGTVLWRDDAANPRMADAVRDDLAKIGIRFSPKLVSSDEMYAACEDPAAHAHLCQLTWLADYPSASTFFRPLYSSGALQGGCCNFSLLGGTPKQLRSWNYEVASVPNVDPRMDACQEAVGTSQIQCWVAFDVYLMEEVVPAIPTLIDIAPWTFSARVAKFTWDQVQGVPALDEIAVKPAS